MGCHEIYGDECETSYKRAEETKGVLDIVNHLSKFEPQRLQESARAWQTKHANRVASLCRNQFLLLAHLIYIRVKFFPCQNRGKVIGVKLSIYTLVQASLAIPSQQHQ